MATEADRQQSFRTYLTDSGVLAFTTKCAPQRLTQSPPPIPPPHEEQAQQLRRHAAAVLVALYEEGTRPENALEFVKASLGAPTAAEAAAREEDARRLRAELVAAHAELDSLRAKLAALGVSVQPTET